jgi:hypothetical protein
LIFKSRAREKTDQEPGDRQHVVPLAIVHGLDPICIPPPRADGVPVWRADRVGEIPPTLHVGDAETVQSKIVAQKLAIPFARPDCPSTTSIMARYAAVISRS